MQVWHIFTDWNYKPVYVVIYKFTCTCNDVCVCVCNSMRDKYPNPTTLVYMYAVLTMPNVLPLHKTVMKTSKFSVFIKIYIYNKLKNLIQINKFKFSFRGLVWVLFIIKVFKTLQWLSNEDLKYQSSFIFYLNFLWIFCYIK